MPSFFYEKKSGISFYQITVIIVTCFKLLCSYPKRPQRKHYKILGVNRVSVFYFTKIKTDGTPLNRVLYIIRIDQYWSVYKKYILVIDLIPGQMSQI